MQINKKLFTTAITALLILSILAVAAPANALTTAPFLVVPSSTPNASAARTSGAVAAKVEVVGNSTSGLTSPFSTVNVYWDTLTGTLLGTVGADSTGAYAINVTIPAAVNGAHYIVTKDDGAAQGVAFTVTASLSVASIPPGPPPVRALPGDSLTLTGNGYAATSAITVVFNSTTISPQVNITLTSPTITTNATGSFSVAVIVPTTITVAQYDTYTVNATDAAGNNATASVVINYYVATFPFAGPAGITITIYGRILANQAYTLTLSGAGITTITIATGTSSATGFFMNPYTIPTLLAAATYTITVSWGTPLSTTSTSFMVTAPPTVSLSAYTGVAGALVTVTGANYVGFANVTLYFGTTVVNSTATDSRFGPTTLYGAITAQFSVPNLTPGIYTVTLTDQYGASASTTTSFTILAAPVTTITTATSFAQGDTISFSIVTTEASFTAGPIVTIRDPAGTTWFLSTAWPLTGTTTKTVLFQDQIINGQHIILPADAPTGSWNWTVTYTPVSTGVSTKATGLFTVAARITLEGLTAQINALNATIQNLQTAVNNLQTSVNNLPSTVSASVTQAISSLQSSLGSLQTSLGSVASDVASLKSSTTDISTSSTAVKSAVDALSSQVTSISSAVASISSAVSSVTSGITALQGAVADIPTEPPTVDMTPVWIAVALSLIAAIAACYAVITIRRKIAG